MTGAQEGRVGLSEPIIYRVALQRYLHASTFLSKLQPHYTYLHLTAITSLTLGIKPPKEIRTINSDAMPF
jgi:hypothetical protein